jgi:pimeloyl-ACP methyl ester carboxylesterase
LVAFTSTSPFYPKNSGRTAALDSNRPVWYERAMVHRTIRSTELHYEERGAGLPLVNLHGWPADHRQMMAMMEPLFQRRSGWRRIYLDLPGMGSSAGPEWLVSHDQMLDVVSDFVEAVTPDQPIVLAGHSYGARLARGLIQRHGDHIAAAFLLSPGIPSAAPEEAGPPEVFAEDPQFDSELTETERSVVGLIRVRTLAVLDVLRTQAIPGLAAADHAFLARIAAGPDFSYATRPDRHFPGPVLIVSGRQEPGGYRPVADLLSIYPRGTCAILDRTGHLLFAEQPTLLAALAAEWSLRRAWGLT